MSDRPILFNGAMVRAIMAGTKTQTRRIVSPKPHTSWPLSAVGTLVCSSHRLDGQYVATFSRGDFTEAYRSEFGRPGDRLWVRESFMDLSGTGIEHRDNSGKLQRFAYAADCPLGSWGDEARKDYGLKWKPSIHMPRSASRIELEVVCVNVERLQHISEAECIAEGCHGGHAAIPGYGYAATATEHFRHLWQALYGKDSWDENPWVWVVEFKQVKA